VDLSSPLPLRLHRGSPTPLAVQIAGQVRDLVTSAALSTGTRLPSSRALAADLGVARAVVEQAYDQLRAEGWLTTRRGAGTYVAALGRPPAPRVPPRQAAEPPATAATGGRRRIVLDTGTPWQDPRLRAGWRRAWRDVAAAPLPAGYPDPAGLPELRAEIAAYVARTRGVLCRPEEVMVTAGTTHAVGLVLSALGSGRLAVEDPGYRAAVATARQSGWRVLDVPVDRDGLDVAHLAACTVDDVRAVYVTPAHQHPLGFTLSAARRVALLAEARRRGAVVLEDDYDSEFRYDVAPVPALTALDRDQSVYLGTASKLLHPALRVGWLVAPPHLVEELAALRAQRHDHPPWPGQRALLTLLGEGHLDKSVRAARRVYAERGALVADRLGRFGALTRPVAGMYATLLLPGPVADAVVAGCAAAGVDVPALAGYSRSSARSGLVVGFGGVTDEELATALDVLEDALERRAT
jgi:GntR family transcriptional regulator / MocR family aminotransferase